MIGLGANWNGATRGGGSGLILPFAAEGSGSATDSDAEFRNRSGSAVLDLEDEAGRFATGEMPQTTQLILPGPISQAFFFDDAVVTGVQGPVGSGKTRTLLYSRLRRACQMPRSVIDGKRHYRLGAVRETYRQLWQTTIPSYLECYPRELGQWSGGRGDPVTHKIEFEDEHGIIVWETNFLAYGDNVEASMRGLQLTDLWPNEADTMSDDVVTVGIGRINRYPGRSHFRGYPPELQGYGQIACDFNAPEDEDAWVFKMFHDKKNRIKVSNDLTEQLRQALKRQGIESDIRIDINFHNQPGGREPDAENLQNLDPGYYAKQVASMQLAGRGDRIARLVDNKITPMRIGEPVFLREFNEDIHVSREPIDLNEDLPLLIGLDQGFTGAAVIGQFEPPMHWIILAEMMFPDRHLLARTFGEHLRDLLDDRFPGMEVGGAWGDMAGERGDSLADDENATWNRIVGTTAGFKVRPQTVGANRIQPRLEAVRAPLEFIQGGRPGLLIDPSCKYMIRGFLARYVWTDGLDKKGNKLKLPDKKQAEANVIDALQYLLLSKSRGDGTSIGSFQRPVVASPRGKAMPKSTGLSYRHDVLNPYGEMT